MVSDLMQQVPDSQALTEPFKKICHLRIFFPGRPGTEWGTGSLVAPRVVLTAAHNINSQTFGKAERIDVTVGGPVVSSALGLALIECKKENFAPSPTWIPTSVYSKEDYGYIILPPNAHRDAVGVFDFDGGVALPSDIMLTVAGYSVDNNPNTRLWVGHGRRLSEGTSKIEYNIDTHAGVSGGPVYYQDSNQRFVLYAMHTNETNRGVGLRIHKGIRNLISSVANQFK